MDPALQVLLKRLEQLSDQFRELKEGVQRAIRIADEDPEMALTRSRKVLEYVIRDVYQRRINEAPGTRPLENLLQRLVKDGYFPDRLDAYAAAIRKLGNVGTHSFGEKVTVADVYQSLAQLMPILEWYFEEERPEARCAQAEKRTSPLANRRLRPAHSSQIEADDPEASDQFAASIREHMATLHRRVERLTAEQFGIICRLRGVRRIRISGCAGSGKTLVAAEKAIRLSRAGLPTLFLCHNPLLAEHARQLTRGSGVQVRTFGEWVAELTGESVQPSQAGWSNYEEPDTAPLNKAFDALAGCGPYDAVIVDEGQDFREEWWTLVEASLAHAPTGTIYIFHDDFQAVLPFRARYPLAEPSLDLSRNCRNAGRVYELVCHLHRQAPTPEEQLRDLGEVLLITYQRTEGRDAITQAIRWIYGKGLLNSLVTLHAGMPLHEQSVLWEPFDVQENLWQAEVRRKFELALRTAESLAPPAGGRSEVSARLAALGAGRLPNEHDVELVRQIAMSFRVQPQTRRRVMNHPQARAPMKWTTREGGLKLWKRGRTQLWASEIIIHFEREDWHKGIPEPETVRFVRHGEARGSGVLPVYRVGDFKGLEADAVLFHLEGSVPISKEELYVGISRARMLLVLVVDHEAMGSLPLAFPALLGKHCSEVSD